MTENLFDDDFLNECKKITEKYDKLCGKWSFADQLNHIHDEVSEVSDVIRNKKDKYGIKGTAQYDLKLLDEVADVFLTTISLVNILEVSNTSLNYAIWKKLEIVGKRVQELSQ